MGLTDDKQTLARYKQQLEEYWTYAQSANSPGGTQITADESRTIEEQRKRIDRLETAIKAQEEGNDGSSSSKQISYSRFVNRVWSWELIDEDVSYHDFGAAIDINFRFGLEERGNTGYWILEQVTLNPNSITGLKLDVTNVKTKYYELNKTLAMVIEFQFIITTADIQVSTKAGVGLNLGGSTKTKLSAGLPPVQGVTVGGEKEQGVSAGLDLSYEFAKSSTQPGSRATVSRSFLCVNKNSKLTISPDVVLDARETAIGDPGMDPFWAGAADWKITTNDSSFKGSIG